MHLTLIKTLAKSYNNNWSYGIKEYTYFVKIKNDIEESIYTNAACFSSFIRNYDKVTTNEKNLLLKVDLYKYGYWKDGKIACTVDFFTDKYFQTAIDLFAEIGITLKIKEYKKHVILSLYSNKKTFTKIECIIISTLTRIVHEKHAKLAPFIMRRLKKKLPNHTNFQLFALSMSILSLELKSGWFPSSGHSIIPTLVQNFSYGNKTIINIPVIALDYSNIIKDKEVYSVYNHISSRYCRDISIPYTEKKEIIKKEINKYLEKNETLFGDWRF